MNISPDRQFFVLSISLSNIKAARLYLVICMFNMYIKTVLSYIASEKRQFEFPKIFVNFVNMNEAFSSSQITFPIPIILKGKFKQATETDV